MTIEIKEHEPLISEITVQHPKSGGKLKVSAPAEWTQLSSPDLVVSVEYRNGAKIPAQGSVWCALTPSDALLLAEALTVFATQQLHQSKIRTYNA